MNIPAMTASSLSLAEQNRYARHLSLAAVGVAGQQKLKAARVLVIGAGGLGCPVLQYLTAAGVGTIGIVDDDLVEESNLQRQILFSPADIGQPKAEVARRKLQAQNPYVQLVAHVARLEAGNALALLAAYQVVIDGSDNFATRYLVNDACVLLHKPLVFGSIFQFEGQVSVFNFRGGPTYRCLYPEAGRQAACAEAGVLGVLPGLVGCLLANETIKLITGAGQVLRGRLLVFDALALDFRTFAFALDPENKKITTLPTPGHAGDPCQTAIAGYPGIEEMSAGELIRQLTEGLKLTVLDVREAQAHAAGNIGAISLPLPLLEKHLDTIPKAIPVVVHCQRGQSSRQAARLLHAAGYKPVYNLRLGFAGLQPGERQALQALLREPGSASTLQGLAVRV